MLERKLLLRKPLLRKLLQKKPLLLLHRVRDKNS